MPPASPSKCVFDPNLCPLLAGLPAEEQRVRMASDPIIRNCIRATEAGKFHPHDCDADKAARLTGHARTRASTGAKAGPKSRVPA